MLIGHYDADLFIATPQRAIESVDSGSAGIPGFVRRPLDGLLARLWRWTAGRRYYLGEWHSHPGGAGTPSSADDETMFAIATDPLANCPEPILLLVGGTLREASEMSAYVYTARRERIKLAQVESLP